ncbi:MAG: hypothetical protein ACFFAN_17890 [Promethearchaeota archaeon]
MVNIKDIANLLEDYMLDTDIEFRELKPYLYSEFKWDVDPLKPSHFMIRGIPISDDIKVNELLKSHMPEEVIILKEI